MRDERPVVPLRHRARAVRALLVVAVTGLLFACGGSGGSGGIPSGPVSFSPGAVSPINVVPLFTPPHTLLEAELGDHDDDGVPDVAWVFATTFMSAPYFDTQAMPGAGDGTFSGFFGGSWYQSAVPPLLTSGNVLGVGAGGHVRASASAVAITVQTFGIRFAVGGGSFGVGGTVSVPGTLAGLTVGDWDGDQIDDVAVADAAGVRLLAFHSLGEAGIAPEQVTALPAGHVPTGQAAGNLDGDADDDVVVGLGVGGYVVLTSLGTGLFSVGTVVALGGVRAFADFVVADVDGDGRQDVAGIVAQPGLPSALGVLFGNGNGTFGSLISTPLELDLGSTALRHLHAGDVNADGRADLAFVAPALDRAVVALSESAGGFVLAADEDLLVGEFDTLSLGDVDGDGDLDLLLGSATALTVRVLLNDLF